MSKDKTKYFASQYKNKQMHKLIDLLVTCTDHNEVSAQRYLDSLHFVDGEWLVILVKDQKDDIFKMDNVTFQAVYGGSRQ